MISAEPAQRVGLAVARRFQQFLRALALLFKVQPEWCRATLGAGYTCISGTIGQGNPLPRACVRQSDRKGWMIGRATLCERGRTPFRGHGGSDRAVSTANQEARAMVNIGPEPQVAAFAMFTICSQPSATMPPTQPRGSESP
jgi:hypothetical protein